MYNLWSTSHREFSKQVDLCQLTWQISVTNCVNSVWENLRLHGFLLKWLYFSLALSQCQTNCLVWVMKVYFRYSNKTVNESKIKWADRAWRLHPRFSIDLHGQKPGRPVYRETRTEKERQSCYGSGHWPGRPRARGSYTTLFLDGSEHCALCSHSPIPSQAPYSLN